MTDLISVLDPIEDFASPIIETIVKKWISDNDLSFGQVMPPFRLALVGEMKGPHLFAIVELLGKEETIKRIGKAIKALQNKN